MCGGEDKRKEKELRREEKERNGHLCFLHKKKKRRVCYEMRDSSLFIKVFYR